MAARELILFDDEPEPPKPKRKPTPRRAKGTEPEPRHGETWTNMLNGCRYKYSRKTHKYHLIEQGMGGIFD